MLRHFGGIRQDWRRRWHRSLQGTDPTVFHYITSPLSSNSTSQPIQDHLGKRWTFIIAAICGVLGILVTYFLVPDVKGNDLAEADEKFRLYLAQNGWHGEMGEDDLKALADEGIPPETVESAEGSSSGLSPERKS